MKIFQKDFEKFAIKETSVYELCKRFEDDNDNELVCLPHESPKKTWRK